MNQNEVFELTNKSLEYAVIVAPVNGASVAYDPASGGLRLWPSATEGRSRVTVSSSVFNSLEVVHPEILQSSRPTSLCWSPIVACNLACPYCLDDKSILGIGNADRMRIATVLAGSDILGLDISGGEPLLLPDLEDLVKVLRDSGIGVSLTTNGWFLRDKAARLKIHLDALRISFDSAIPDEHDHYRGQGSFAKAIEGLRVAINLGMRVQIHHTVIRSNLSSLPALINMAHIEGASGVTLLQLLPIGEASHFPSNEFLTDDELRNVELTLGQSKLPVRVRYRAHAEGFTVIRADGWVYRNSPRVQSIKKCIKLLRPEDLGLSGDSDGSM